jgi:hypothetical protein
MTISWFRATDFSGAITNLCGEWISPRFSLLKTCDDEVEGRVARYYANYLELFVKLDKARIGAGAWRGCRSCFALEPIARRYDSLDDAKRILTFRPHGLGDHINELVRLGI